MCCDVFRKRFLFTFHVLHGWNVVCLVDFIKEYTIETESETATEKKEAKGRKIEFVSQSFIQTIPIAVG